MPQVLPRPNRIRVVVTRDTIALDNETPGVDPTKVWALPGGKVHYVVENTDRVRHTVSIPLGEFVPKLGDATAEPLEANQKEEIDVEPGLRRTLVFAVKRLSHFGFNKDRSMSMTYKYTVHTLPAGGKKITLDPDLEIDQP